MRKDDLVDVTALDQPDTIRVRLQELDADGRPVYLDEYEDVGAAYFRMDEDRFEEALFDVYADWITVIKAPATFRCRLTLTGNTKTSRREAARRRRLETVRQWLEERCIVDPAVEEMSSVLTRDCRQWHEERGLDDVAAPTVIGRVVQERAVGLRNGGGGRRVVLGVALKYR